MLCHFVDTTRAVQHLLRMIGYESSGSGKLGDVAGEQSPVAMEIEPEDIQWMKVHHIYVAYYEY